MKPDIEMLQHFGRQHVLDENGEPVILSSLWETQRAVIVFVRHFG